MATSLLLIQIKYYKVLYGFVKRGDPFFIPKKVVNPLTIALYLFIYIVIHNARNPPVGPAKS